ncbi:MAG: hypothetical protein KDD63_07320 [Bacteroidetes bacterium]|nr:hypothetical protein [Bacteroidota bacterium]
MKKKLLYASPVLLILWILLTGWNITRAQDLIYYYSGEIAQVNLIEITDEHIIFAPYGQPEYDVVKIDKTQVKRVVQNQNGKILKSISPEKDMSPTAMHLYDGLLCLKKQIPPLTLYQQKGKILFSKTRKSQKILLLSLLKK